MNLQRPQLGFVLNGRARRLRRAADAGGCREVLREAAGLTGTKVGCDAGDCGACTVLLDGRAVCACLTPAARVEGRAVMTVEGLDGPEAVAAARRRSTRHGAAQCGICTPGMLIAATALLARVPQPSRAEVEAALGGVLCRCTGYRKIIAAVCDANGASPAAGRAGAGRRRGRGAAAAAGRPRRSSTAARRSAPMSGRRAGWC